MILKIIYSIFIGILVALFIGLGIEAFYPSPKYPESPLALEIGKQNPTSEDEEKIKLFKEEEKKYFTTIATYNRNVSIITLTLSIFLLTLSLVMSKKILLISDGLLLGSVFTLIYSIGRAFGANNQKFVFGITTIALIIAIGIGYLKFIKGKPTSDLGHRL